MRVNIGFPVVRTDGRAYGHVITKFSRMGSARVELRYDKIIYVDLALTLSITFRVCYSIKKITKIVRAL